MLWVVAVLALVVIAVAGTGMLHAYRRGIALQRLEQRDEGDVVVELPETVRPLVVRHRWVAVLVAGGAAIALSSFVGWPAWIALAFGLVAGAVAFIVEDFLASRKELRLEEQLADAIDLMVSALRSGTSLVDAIGIAAEESRRPLRTALEETLQRLRLGDNPDRVFEDLGKRADVETARVLSFTLMVHWRVGGSLAPALATVSGSARHRIEFSRRVRSQAMEGRASLVGMLAITYLLTLLLWKAYPERFEAFFSSEIGIGLTATVVFMQATGLVWMTMMTRIRA